MSRTGVVISVVVALALAVAAYFALGPRRGGEKGATSEGTALPFGPGDVATLEVASPGAPPSRLTRSALFGGGWVLWPAGAPQAAAWPVRASNVQGALRVLSDLRKADGPVPGDEAGGSVRLVLHSGQAWEVRFESAAVAGMRRAAVTDPSGARSAATCDAAVAAALFDPGPRLWREDFALPALGPEVESIRVVTPGRGVRLDRTAGGWAVAEPVAAPADGATVAALLRALSGVRLLTVPEFDPTGSVPEDTARAGSIEVTEVRRAGDATIRLRRSLVLLGEPSGLVGQGVKTTLSLSTTSDSSSPEHRSAWTWSVAVDGGGLSAITSAPEAYLSRTAWSGDPGSVGALEFTPPGDGEPTLRLVRGLDGWSSTRPEGPLPPAAQAHPGSLVTLLATERAARLGIDPEGAEPGGIGVRVLSLGGSPLAEAVVSLRGEPGAEVVNVVVGRVWREYATGSDAVRWVIESLAEPAAAPPP